MTQPQFDRINSHRLVLEAFEAEHVSDEYLGWLRDPAVVRFSNQRFRVHTARSAREYVASFIDTANRFLAVKLAQSGRMIGTMTAYIAEQHGTADIGLLIGDRTMWGQGYGLEAWSTLMNYLLQSRGMRKITAGAVRPNIGMLRIMERSSMHLEAVRGRQEIVDGVEEDVLYYARFVDR